MVRFLSILALAASLVACSSSTPVLDTGVPNDTQVDELTDAEARQICERAEGVANDLFGVEQQHYLTCMATAIAYDIANLGECKDSFNDCINESFTGEAPDLNCENVTAPMLTNCNATIGQLEACANAQLRVYDDLIDQVDCSLANDPGRAREIVDGLEADAMPEACTSLPETCPIFFDGFDDEMMP